MCRCVICLSSMNYMIFIWIAQLLQMGSPSNLHRRIDELLITIPTVDLQHRATSDWPSTHKGNVCFFYLRNSWNDIHSREIAQNRKINDNVDRSSNKALSSSKAKVSMKQSKKRSTCKRTKNLSIFSCHWKRTTLFMYTYKTYSCASTGVQWPNIYVMCLSYTLCESKQCYHRTINHYRSSKQKRKIWKVFFYFDINHKYIPARKMWKQLHLFKWQLNISTSAWKS